MAANIIARLITVHGTTLTSLSRDGDEIKVGIHPTPSAEVQEEIISPSTQQGEPTTEKQETTESTDSQSKKERSKSKEKPKLGQPPDFDSPYFNLKQEIDRLPFPINLGNM